MIRLLTTRVLPNARAHATSHKSEPAVLLTMGTVRHLTHAFADVLHCGQGRKLWGQCFNGCRNIARSALVYIDSDALTYATILRNLKAFPVALKQHLRGEFEMVDFVGTLNTRELNELASADNLPLAVITQLSMTINVIKKDEAQSANAMLWWILENHISSVSA